MKNYINLLLASIFIFGCGNDQRKEETEGIDLKTEIKIINKDLIEISKSQLQSENMSIVNLENKDFPDIIKTTGIVDVPPTNRATIGAFEGGYIKNSPLLVGDEVSKNQILVKIENPEFLNIQKEYLEAFSQLNYLKTEYERQQILFKENISSQKNFLRAESDYNKTLASSLGLERKLEMLNINPTMVRDGKLTTVSNIYSPIGGSIVDVNVSIGQYVSPADQIMEIINMDHIHLELKVFEKDILKLKKDQKIIFRVPESSDESFEASIHLIGTSIDEDRRIKVHAHIDHDLDINFIVGMFIEADIIVAESSSPSIPEDALVEINDQNFVLVLEEEVSNSFTFVKKMVTTGRTYDGYIELIDLKDFEVGDKILIGGYNLIGI